MTIQQIPVQASVMLSESENGWVRGNEIRLDDIRQESVLTDKKNQTEEPAQPVNPEPDETLKKAAYDEGFRAGEIAARNSMNEELEQLRKIVSEVQTYLPVAVKELEDPLMEITQKMCAIVLGVSSFDSELFREAMLEKLREMLARLIEQKRIVIEMNPDSLLLIEKNDLFSNFNTDAVPELILLPDKRLKPGECIIKSEDFLIDGTFSGQTEHIISQLVDEVIA